MKWPADADSTVHMCGIKTWTTRA